MSQTQATEQTDSGWLPILQSLAKIHSLPEINRQLPHGEDKQAASDLI